MVMEEVEGELEVEEMAKEVEEMEEQGGRSPP